MGCVSELQYSWMQNYGSSFKRLLLRWLGYSMLVGDTSKMKHSRQRSILVNFCVLERFKEGLF